jgi:FkbM family methyltransferase
MEHIMSFLKKVYRRGKMLLNQVRIPKGQRALRHVHIQGFEMLVLANEDVGRIINLFGDFEPEETIFFRGLIKSDDVCLDIGGNVGYFSMLMAQCARQGEVHVFEPIPLNAALIRTNVELNNFSNVVINNVALAEARGTAEFSVSVDSAYSSLKATGRKSEAKIITVPLWTLDDYVAEKKLQSIALMKVDVEGAEEMVLKGAKGLFGDLHRRPRIVMLELVDINLRPFGTSVASIVEQMVSHGYKPMVLQNGKFLSPYTPNMANRYPNIFFTI